MNIKNIDQSELPLLPSFGSAVKFSSISEVMTFGDNHSQRMLAGINGLLMSANIKFEELTDIQSQKVISFLQKYHYYEPQSYNADGSFDNKRIEAFDYQPFYPYKNNKFFCVNFSHEKEYHNVNSVRATLASSASSILDSAESSAGHNNNIDQTIEVVLNGSSLVGCHPFTDVELDSGSIIYHSGDYVNAQLTSPFVHAQGITATLSASSHFASSFTSSRISCPQTNFRNSIFINNPNDCSYYPYKPIHEDGELDFRMFDFRPSDSIALAQSPKYRDSSVSSAYKKFNKYGFNPSLMNLKLTFRGRSDIEAKRILLFLESHLGCQKFGFHALMGYGNKSDSLNTSPHRKSYSTFYCPDWEHTFVYKDNHQISATFIECINY
jgi:phage-related protein